MFDDGNDEADDTGAVDWAALPVGGELAAALAGVEPIELCPADRIEFLKATARLESWTVSRRNAALVAVHDSCLSAGERAIADDPDLADPPRLMQARVDWRACAEADAAAQAALALGVSPHSAGRLLHHACALAAPTAPLGHLAGALETGRVSEAGAAAVIGALSQADPAGADSDLWRHVDTAVGTDPDTLTPEQRRQILAKELALPGIGLRSVPPGRLKAITAMLIAAARPTDHQQRALAARAGRRVELLPLPDAMALLRLTLPAEAATAAWRDADAAARTARAAGDPRTLDQLRADHAAALLTAGLYGTPNPNPARASTEASDGTQPAGTDSAGGAATPDDSAGREADSAGEPTPATAATAGSPGAAGTAGSAGGGCAGSCRPRVLVQLTMSAPAALGLSDQPAHLGGYGPIPAALARHLAHHRNARWRRILTDPATGIATDTGTTYHPPPRISSHVLARDGHTSRFPTSGATHLDLDHVHPHADGGPTSAANLQALGRRDHRTKHTPGWNVTGNANGELTWTTPTGHTYPSWPPPIANPDPAADTGNDPDTGTGGQPPGTGAEPAGEWPEDWPGDNGHTRPTDHTYDPTAAFNRDPDPDPDPDRDPSPEPGEPPPEADPDRHSGDPPF